MRDMPWQPLDATHPDPLVGIIDYLRVMLDPVRVSVSLIGWTRPDPIVQLHRVGGSFKTVDDEAEYQVDVRADSYDACRALTADVRRHLLFVPETGLVRRSVEDRGPEWSTDEDGKDRVRMEWTFAVPPEEV